MEQKFEIYVKNRTQATSELPNPHLDPVKPFLEIRIWLYSQLRSSGGQKRWNHRFTLERWFFCDENIGLIVFGTLYSNRVVIS